MAMNSQIFYELFLNRRYLSVAEKKEIEAFAKSKGIKPPKTECQEVDYFMQIKIAIAQDEQKELLKNSKRNLFLRAGLHVTFKGEIVNEYTIKTDKQIKDLIKKGFPKKLTRTRKELEALYFGDENNEAQ